MPKSKRYKGDNPFVYSTDPDFVFNKDSEAEESLAPGQQLLKVSLDTKNRRGKTVTLVEGFTGNPGDLESLGKKLKNAFGTGGSVKDGIIIIQGDYVVRIKTLLKDWGYGIK